MIVDDGSNDNTAKIINDIIQNPSEILSLNSLSSKIKEYQVQEIQHL